MWKAVGNERLNTLSFDAVVTRHKPPQRSPECVGPARKRGLQEPFANRRLGLMAELLMIARPVVPVEPYEQWKRGSGFNRTDLSLRVLIMDMNDSAVDDVVAKWAPVRTPMRFAGCG